MSPSIQQCLAMFKFGNGCFLEKISTTDKVAANKRLSGDVNPILWLAGHLLNSRKYLLELLGEKQELPYEAMFRAKYDPTATYPSMDEIKKAWVSISDALFAKMEQATDEQYAQPVDWNLPNGDKTVRGAFLFYSYHEGWHMGQVAYARKAMGMEGLVPY